MTVVPEERLDGPSLVSVFAELGAYERAFNDIQARYRLLASTWLLGAIAAIGFVLTKKLNVSIDPEILVTGVSFAGTSGIGLLWNLDLMVYNRLLESVFAAGLKLEDDFPQLPKVRTIMHQQLHNAGPRIVYFYVVPTALLMLVAVVGLVVWTIPRGGGWRWVLDAIAAVVAAVWPMLMFRHTCEAEQRFKSARDTAEKAGKGAQPA
jgi:hypothetical protein